MVVTARRSPYNSRSIGFIRHLLSESDFTVRRILSLPGLAVAVWVSCLAFMGLLAGMVAVVGLAPAFPARDADAGPRDRLGTGSHRRGVVADRPRPGPASCPVVPADRRGAALVPGRPSSSTAWRPARGGTAPRSLAQAARSPGRLGDGPRGAIPLSATHVRREGRDDLVADARGRGPRPGRRDGPAHPRPRGTAGADDQVDCPLGARAAGGHAGQGRPGYVHGEPAGRGIARCRGPRPTDRHEVAHCVLTSQCSAWFDPPAVLAEGWAEANQGPDLVEQAGSSRRASNEATGSPSASSPGRDWYDRHEWPVYIYGGAAGQLPPPSVRAGEVPRALHHVQPVDLRVGLPPHPRPGPRRPRRRRSGPRSSGDRPRPARSIGAGSNSSSSVRTSMPPSGRRSSPNTSPRPSGCSRPIITPGVTAVGNRSSTNAGGQTESYLVRGSRAPLGRVRQLAAHNSPFRVGLPLPTASIARGAPHRNGSDVAGRGRIETNVRAVSPSCPLSHRHPRRGRKLDRRAAGQPLPGPGESLPWGVVVAGLERFTENGRPRVRVRIDDRSPTDESDRWRSKTFVLAADDMYATLSERSEGGDRDIGDVSIGIHLRPTRKATRPAIGECHDDYARRRSRDDGPDVC